MSLPGLSKSTSLRALTARSWAVRISLVFIVTFGILLLTVSRFNDGFIASLRSAMSDAVMPVMAVAAQPVNAVSDARAWVSEMFYLRSENVALKAKVAYLSRWQTFASQMKAENDALRKLINVVPPGNLSYVAARIVSETGGPFSRAALINGGMDDGIGLDQAVIGTEGLVGRVIELNHNSARVLLVTDINSRVPVISELSRERSILAGNNASELSLQYVDSESNIRPGERLLTTGDGGIFPPGIPVGEVISVNGESVSVRPITDWTRLEYVSVISYEF